MSIWDVGSCLTSLPGNDPPPELPKIIQSAHCWKISKKFRKVLSQNFEKTKFFKNFSQNFGWKIFHQLEKMGAKFRDFSIQAFTWCVWLWNFRIWVGWIMNVNIWVLIQIPQISQMRIFKCHSVDCFNFVTVDWCNIYFLLFIFERRKIRNSQKFQKKIWPKNTILTMRGSHSTFIFGPKILENLDFFQ